MIDRRLLRHNSLMKNAMVGGGVVEGRAAERDRPRIRGVYSNKLRYTCTVAQL